MTQKKITLCGKTVELIYCTATENGFELISPNTINVFVPTFGKDKEGNDVIIEPARATVGDFITLAVAAIVAAYTRKGQEPPVTSEEILYDITPQERNELLTAIIELRNEWYAVPKSVEETLKKENEAAKGEGEEPKNA